jgi:hypothetical protein
MVNVAMSMIFYSALLVLVVVLIIAIGAIALAPGNDVGDKRPALRSAKAAIDAREAEYEAWKAKEAA